eukprot:TRINITY_DN578546_c0_g3_i1.p1 TRINITY_DN578546_c0_g3~~TRINITY_DN578546_c0_g3_i1.p1  ORF type:complete len:650 (+),score=232.50 TRINITY_DN578546_c0_g3_i1:29-1978(+)
MPELKIYNSLKREKDVFVPIDGKRVLWYTCGPTVYDASHMGHARTYLAFDIIRRVMSDYFGYNVVQVMNITDIDDKIIKRSNENGVVFSDLARKWENEFFNDMSELGCLKPAILTRVSEYVPEIIAFIEKIIENGYAYESNGSVYFNTKDFSENKDHTYGKLVPENVGNVAAVEEGEGVLTENAGSKDKRNPCDFALWKAAKPEEPSWPSPWGNGRPGWHIECSAMCSEVTKQFAAGEIDIHSGGFDLRFPHHENEIAQSEAYFNSDSWVRYFMHSGHLDIEGRKMSKSLKNFVTIKECMETYTARQIRLFFLLHPYNKRMDYSTSGMDEAKVYEKRFTEMFGLVSVALRQCKEDAEEKFSDLEQTLNASFQKIVADVDAALCDDFDTPVAIKKMAFLANDVNRYLAACTEEHPVRPMFLRSIVDYITYMFRCFGVVTPLLPYGFPTEGESSGQSRETVVGPILDAMADYRETMRKSAGVLASQVRDMKKMLKDIELPEGFMAELEKLNGSINSMRQSSDDVRDTVLPELGVKLTDTEGKRAQWQLVTKEELEREKQEREEKKRKEIEKKEAMRALKAKREAEKLALSKIPPSELFTKDTDKYSAFDDKGIPTTSAAGEPISKKQLKKLQKQFQAQLKLHTKYLASLEL